MWSGSSILCSGVVDFGISLHSSSCVGCFCIRSDSWIYCFEVWESLTVIWWILSPLCLYMVTSVLILWLYTPCIWSTASASMTSVIGTRIRTVLVGSLSNNRCSMFSDIEFYPRWLFMCHRHYEGVLSQISMLLKSS